MAEIKKKHVTSEALQGALGVVKDAMPGAATKQKAGLVKPGNGLSVDNEGNVSVDNGNIDARAQAIVEALKLKTINGESIKGEGDIVIDLSLFKIVDKLPTTDILNKVYLVKNEEAVPDGELNVYVEWIHANGKWEKLGEFKTAIDLTPYALKTYVDTSLEDAVGVARTYVDNALDEIRESVSDDALKAKFPNLTADLSLMADQSYVDETFVKASELEALCMTAADGQALAEAIFA